jgi:hypothetical protein
MKEMSVVRGLLQQKTDRSVQVGNLLFHLLELLLEFGRPELCFL